MKAPGFTLHDQNNTIHSLEDYRGEWLVVYFYPKDSTPGCTKEACAFRDGRDLLKDAGANIVGISKDSVNSHEKFANNNSLNFTLLSDPTAVVIEAYGAWGKKKFMGREYMGIKRNTYLINPNGEIVKTYENVNPVTHFNEILTDLNNYIGKISH
jgi:peroxiredoxin Q/BCP